MASVTRDGGYVVLRLDPQERRVLSGFVESVMEMLAPQETGSDPLATLTGIDDSAAASTRPDDPALLRLLPDAYAGADDAAEFRRFTDNELRSEKAAALGVMLAAMASAADDDGAIRMTADDVHTWVTAINDVRLVLGVRLGVTEDRDERQSFAADDPRTPLSGAYDWLTWMQQALLEEIDPDI